MKMSIRCVQIDEKLGIVQWDTMEDMQLLARFIYANKIEMKTVNLNDTKTVEKNI